MAVIALVALAVRVSWVLIARRNFALHGDDFFYHWQANALADGKGFLNPYTWKALGRLEPSAAHPPLYSLYLSVYSWLGFTTPLAHRLASCLLGVAAVVVIGLVARRIAGDRAGLVAAGIAAVYPQLWINDGMLISESMYVLVIAVTLLLTYRLWESRRWTDAAWLGVAIGLSALTRPEAVILVPLLGVPFLFSRREPFARRLGTLFVIGGLCLVVILPWWVRNLTQFHDPTFLATGNGVVLQVSNCDGTYSGQFLGYWDIKCLTGDAPPAERAAGADPARNQRSRPRLSPRARPARRLAARHDGAREGVRLHRRSPRRACRSSWPPGWAASGESSGPSKT